MMGFFSRLINAETRNPLAQAILQTKDELLNAYSITKPSPEQKLKAIHALMIITTAAYAGYRAPRLIEFNKKMMDELFEYASSLRVDVLHILTDADDAKQFCDIIGDKNAVIEKSGNVMTVDGKSALSVLFQMRARTSVQSLMDEIDRRREAVGVPFGPNVGAALSHFDDTVFYPLNSFEERSNRAKNLSGIPPLILSDYLMRCASIANALS